MRTALPCHFQGILALALGLVASAPSAYADPVYQTTDLGIANPIGLNNSGQILLHGSYWDGANQKGAVYNSSGNDAGQEVSLPILDVTAINNNGIVSGSIKSRDAPYGKAVLYTPSDLPAPIAPVLTAEQIPEPSTLAFATVLGAALGCQRAFRRFQQRHPRSA